MLVAKSLEKLTEMVNQKFLEIHILTKKIYIAKISKKRNVAIQPVDDIKAQKVQENTSQIQAAFGKGAKLVTKSYKVVVHGVVSYKISPKNKEVSIQYLVDKNHNAFYDLFVK